MEFRNQPTELGGPHCSSLETKWLPVYCTLQGWHAPIENKQSCISTDCFCCPAIRLTICWLWTESVTIYGVHVSHGRETLNPRMWILLQAGFYSQNMLCTKNSLNFQQPVLIQLVGWMYVYSGHIDEYLYSYTMLYDHQLGSPNELSGSMSS